MSAQVINFKPSPRRCLYPHQQIRESLRARGVNVNDFNAIADAMVKALAGHPEFWASHDAGLELTKADFNRWVLEGCAKDPVELAVSPSKEGGH